MSYQSSAASLARTILGLALGASTAWAADTAYDSGGSGAAARLLQDAGRAAYHGRYTEAIADTSKALALAPNYGAALNQRAHYYMATGRYADSAADLDRVLAMHPADMGLAMDRVELALHRSDGKAALLSLKQALALPLFSYRHSPQEASSYEAGSGDHYAVTGHMESIADEYGSIAHQLLHNDDAALIYMQNMLKLETEHPEYRLADYCYLAGIAGLLESAELMCQQAIDDNPHDIGQYDSLGYVHVRMKQWDKAIADYNTALDKRPDLTLSLYGRGIARRAKGDTAGGNADIAKATKNEPDIANIMQRLGIPAI